MVVLTPRSLSARPLAFSARFGRRHCQDGAGLGSLTPRFQFNGGRFPDSVEVRTAAATASKEQPLTSAVPFG